MTRKPGETRTIQTWPGGQSFEYRGDPDGPANQKSLRFGYWQSRLNCPEHCWRVTLTPVSRGVANSQMIVVFPGHGPCLEISASDSRVGQHCRLIESAGGISGFAVEVCLTCNGEGFVPNPKRNPWRKGTAEEWRSIRVSLRAENYQRNMIHRNVSALVSDLMQLGDTIRRGEPGYDLAEGFGIDEIRNLYGPDPSDWNAEQCREYASDNGIDLPEMPTVTPDVPDDFPVHPLDDDEPAQDRATCNTCDRSWDDAVVTNYTPSPAARCPFEAFHEMPDLDAEEDDSPRGWLTEAREACREHAQENPAYVYEWYLVDSWLCEQLHRIGEVTIDNGYGDFWGRTCTGQSLLMDGTLQKIAAQYESVGAQ